jgi:hypothetical protein
MTNQIIGIVQNKAQLNVELKNKNANIIANISDKTHIEANITSRGTKGDTGDKGDTGATGQSAYDLWLSQGHTGTLDDFFNSLGVSLTTNAITQTDENQFVSQIEKARISGYVHYQIASSKVWTINHNLDIYPAVSVVDTADNVVVGEIRYMSRNQLVISFSAEFSGKAYLS